MNTQANDWRSGIVDFQSPSANMYGCQPCPKCGSKFRASYKSGRSAGMVACDDCGHHEPAMWKDEEDDAAPVLPPQVSE